jgi:hypothetical protein
MTEQQIALFSSEEEAQWRSPHLPVQELSISAAMLTDWKQRIAAFQHQVRHEAVEQQSCLFDLPELSTTLAASPDVNQLDPFTLPQQNTEFWRGRAADVGTPSLYFVLDYDVPLLLYVGETVKSNQRWKGEHDCKRYLTVYRQAHYQQAIASRLGIAFWKHAPANTRSRQKLELSLIHKWRSPFNKENWTFWGTPFVGKG